MLKEMAINTMEFLEKLSPAYETLLTSNNEEQLETACKEVMTNSYAIYHNFKARQFLFDKERSNKQ